MPAGVGYGMAVDAEPGHLWHPSESFTGGSRLLPQITSRHHHHHRPVGRGKEGAGQGGSGLAASSRRDTFHCISPRTSPKVQDARTVVKDGYFLFVIAENADEAVARL